MKDKKAKTAFTGLVIIKIINESIGKSNKSSWVDKGKVFQNSLMQKWLDDNDILMYLTQNECKSIVAERFIRNMTANDSKSYLGYLNMSVDEYSNIYHRSI